jgi:hypothetical protein
LEIPVFFSDFVHGVPALQDRGQMGEDEKATQLVLSALNDLLLRVKVREIEAGGDMPCTLQ